MSIYSAADRGGNSAWKGFSSQTTYIASRLISETDNAKTYYPESIEDLKITDANDAVLELIQIKNLSADLVLSDFNPQKEGSFLKRALDTRQRNPVLIVRLISYGNIGYELLKWGKLRNDKRNQDTITTKLLSYGYSLSNIEWLRNNILIEKSDESELEKLIFTELSENIETAISPEVAYDILVNYVSSLSRRQMSTSKVLWKEKVRALSLSLSAISGWQNQFGKTILPLSEHRDFDVDDLEFHRNEYNNGVNALPQHILNGFDIIRPYWLDVLKDGFSKQNITIIHGASGQGKSSLAYRYLIDNYTEKEIFIVSGISNQQQATDIGVALRELQKNEFNMIVYIDVRPFDKNWVWLVEHVFTYNLKIPVLITIREEDYNRNPIDRNYVKYNDVELVLNEEEAQDLYERYPTDKHLSFEDSWKAFGEYNLLMEYVFFLRENESLKNRLQAQIEKLILEEDGIDNWLSALLAISYAGRKEVPLDIEKLLRGIDIKNHIKMLQVFNKEYWVRWVKDNRTLSTIHPVRAMLLCEILFEKLLEDEANVLLNTIQFTNYYPQALLIDYFYRKSIDSAFLTKLSNISFTTWVTYAGILESLLWLSVWQYYKKYESVIDEGNSLTNNAFAFVFITEVTGYLTVDRSFHDIIREQNPTKFLHTSTLLERIAEKSIGYECVDGFMKNTIDSLPFNDALSSSTLTYCGFSLFWIAQRNLILDETKFNEIIETLDVTDIFSVCELCLGMQKQGWHKHYDYTLRKLKPLLTEQLNIVYLDDESSILQAFVINDFQSNVGNHGKIMLAINALRLLYCEKEEYHVTLIGSDIIEGIPVLDNIKRIKNDNLPYKWITRLNGWFLSIDGYKYLLSDWKAIFDEIIDKRQEVQDFATYLTKAIDDYFSNRKIDKFTDKAYLKRESLFKYANYNINLPKCASNMYGMSIGISNFDDISSSLKEKAKKKKTNNDEESSSKEYLSVIKVFNDYIQDMQKFLTQKDDLLVDKLKNNDISRLGRLSWVNLMFMLEKFPKMVSIFKQEFSKFITNESCDINEEENLFLLGIMWEYVYSNPYRIEKSVMYDKKRELKRKKEIITKFIEDVIPNIRGVQEVVYRENNEIFILLDILYGDSFIEDIWTQYEKLFGKLEYASFDYALLTLFFKKISIQSSFETEPTIGGFEISNMDFTKDTKEEFFASVRSKAMGFDNYYWSIQDNRIKYILTILGLIENIPIILKHVEDVLSYFEQMQDEKRLIPTTVNKWKLSCDLLTKDIFKQINDACKALNEYLRHEDQRNLLNNFVDVTDSLLSIDDFLINLVASGGKYKNDFTIDTYKESFSSIIDFLVKD